MTDETTTKTTEAPKPAPEAKPADASKKMTWKGDGESIDYTAYAELLPVRDKDNAFIGNMFMFSQVADMDDTSDRPVTFCWNGGPGGASYMVNIGGMGARRVPDDGEKHINGVGKLEDNPYTLLRASDLVFIDAFGTGYSRVDPSYDGKKVWGVDGDGDAFVRGIIAWLRKHNRFNSPLYLYGESYGTMRNAVVYRMLGEHGVGVRGVIEQSTILDYAPTLSGNDAYYLGMTPVYAATAAYFGKAGEGYTEHQWFDKAFEFVDNTLSQAITMGDRLPQERMKAVANEMSELIGLPAEFIMAKGLRIELDTFRKNLLKDEGKTLGRYDMRFTTYAYQDVQGDNEFYAGEDPSYDGINSAYLDGYMHMLHDEIGFEGFENYEPLSLKVNMDWNWNHQAPGTMGSPQTPDVAFDIATALRRNPTSRILFFGGIHDAATPYWNVRHDMGKLFLPAELKDRIEYHVHSNGHMAYADLKALQAMSPELMAFYDKRHTPVE
ncbi:S10 family peptidase [Bifidobacterium gallicum]|uniref:Peptidase S10 n=1 Tax=Bifidobacterium gallicum DSM 20093 = LMG 11596 TaxID=561180 RepID=D1NTD2_9BIFI|nr:peptidase S10 [Bifidobacterium gallicum]EFA22986.1 serine carboxypeptidase [Bifidobacterium gallicum DSM 20093 = LMG 11596]KFI57696.1 peptidase S10 [Bifidobacterium gallicum DSM 20093 = LMG 11596]